MNNQEKLFEAFGELLYVMAMADGMIQESERRVIQNRLKGHKWAKDIQWSFDYEVKKENNLDDLYKKVVFYCEEHGPDEEYAFFVEMLVFYFKTYSSTSYSPQEG